MGAHRSYNRGKYVANTIAIDHANTNLKRIPPVLNLISVPGDIQEVRPRPPEAHRT